MNRMAVFRFSPGTRYQSYINSLVQRNAPASVYSLDAIRAGLLLLLPGVRVFVVRVAVVGGDGPRVLLRQREPPLLDHLAVLQQGVHFFC